MSSLERSIETIRRAHQRLGTVELARRAGVPYTTVNDCKNRNFVGPAVETLLKLAVAAERVEADVEESDRASTAA